jgi:hypothetical protein
LRLTRDLRASFIGDYNSVGALEHIRTCAPLTIDGAAEDENTAAMGEAAVRHRSDPGMGLDGHYGG